MWFVLIHCLLANKTSVEKKKLNIEGYLLSMVNYFWVYYIS